MKKLIVPVFLCLFLFCGCQSSPPPPNFDFTALMESEAEDYTCEVICSKTEAIEVKTVIPELISGMTAKAGNSLVSVSFGGTVKNSQQFPGIRNFSCSKAALILDCLRRAELQLYAKDEGRLAFTADTELGKLILVTDKEGNILGFSQENSGFTLRLAHRYTQKPEP